MNIDLGTKYPSGPCEPCSKPDKNLKSYPCLYIDCGEALLKNLPDEGVIELRYKVTSRSTNEREGKKNCSLTLEAREILEIEVSDEKPETAESAIDKLAELLTAKDED